MNQQDPSGGADEIPTGIDEAAIRVDRGALVLPSGCTMPQVCILTCRPVSEHDMILENLSWCSPREGLAWLLGAPQFLFSYFTARQLCLITYGLDPPIRRRLVTRTVFKVIVMFALLAATIALAVTNSTHWLIGPSIAALFISFLASVVFVFVGNSPLRVVDYRDGLFWIRGFSGEYLAALDLGGIPELDVS